MRTVLLTRHWGTGIVGEISRDISVDYGNYLNRDYKTSTSRTGERQSRVQRKHLHALAVFAATVGLVALFSPSHEAEATRDIGADEVATENAQRILTEQELLNLPLELPNSLETFSTTEKYQRPDALDWRTITVRPGDNMSVIFDRLHLSPQQLQEVVDADRKHRYFSRLRIGQQLEFQIDGKQLHSIRYTLSPEKSYQIRKNDSGFESLIKEAPLDTRLSHASGVIETSLYQSGLDAGLSNGTIMELASIFGWDIDFALDIRKGDNFSLIYEQQYLDGEKLRDGRILAAEFTNQGKTYQAVLFTDEKGRGLYYAPDGSSMRKTFLRSPVDFHRISSRFKRERWHPVLGKKRPHRGVDYAAKIGTPIKASGDGRVIFRGRKGGYGKTVVLQHGGNITTLYAHMSHYRRGVTNGSRVRQGQVIGYVGKTGLATGPHLHYEFRVNGVHGNPLTIKLPNAKPIQAKYKDIFQLQSRQLLAQLELLNTIQVAQAAAENQP
ncbi:OapA family protein [Sedimenticola sp.]|uniref:OapA family protein n=1 Tax=Sedimenticola sp. TaxID=1940285 RepID=UPI003D127C6B